MPAPRVIREPPEDVPIRTRIAGGLGNVAKAAPVPPTPPPVAPTPPPVPVAPAIKSSVSGALGLGTPMTPKTGIEKAGTAIGSLLKEDPVLRARQARIDANRESTEFGQIIEQILHKYGDHDVVQEKYTYQRLIDIAAWDPSNPRLPIVLVVLRQFLAALGTKVGFGSMGHNAHDSVKQAAHALESALLPMDDPRWPKEVMEEVALSKQLTIDEQVRPPPETIIKSIATTVGAVAGIVGGAVTGNVALISKSAGGLVGLAASDGKGDHPLDASVVASTNAEFDAIAGSLTPQPTGRDHPEMPAQSSGSRVEHEASPVTEVELQRAREAQAMGDPSYAPPEESWFDALIRWIRSLFT